MCTAISLTANDHYFGRNLDLNYSFQESVVVMPRKFPLKFRCTKATDSHFAMIGVATVDNGYPLFYDAVNEYGLSIAGLNFPDNAAYLPKDISSVNITPFEFIPWILCQCKTVAEAETLLKKVRIVDIPYNDRYSLTPLHWIIADKDRSITVEPMASQVMIYENPFGILTNNPQFPYHLDNLRHYTHLSPQNPVPSSWNNLRPVSNGTGALGLPGDFSSVSRFIRAAFIKETAAFNDDDRENIMQFFHMLQSVQQVYGSVRNGDQYHKTVYSSCCNATQGIYYYTTYYNSQVTGINMHHNDLECKEITIHPLNTQPVIKMDN